MKNFIKLALAFALGIFVTIAVIKMFLSEPAPVEPFPDIDIQAEIKEAVDAALLIKGEPVETETIQEPEIEADVTTTTETSEPEETAEEIKPEPAPVVTTTPEPKTEPKVIVTTSQATQAKPTEPEYFYEDGEKYAIINGFKSHIVEDKPGATEIESYD